MYKTIANIALCCAVFVAAFCAFLGLAPNRDVAYGATATVSVEVDSASTMPFDLDYTLKVADTDGKIVKQLNFNGVPDTVQTFSLTVGQKYSLFVSVPTSVFCTIVVGNAEVNSSYVGYDFVMPNSSLSVILSLYTQNPSIFTDSNII